MDGKIKKTYLLSKPTIDILVDAAYEIQKQSGKKIPHSTILDAALQAFLNNRQPQDIIDDIAALCPAGKES